MRVANIIAAVSFGLWLSLTVLGCSLIQGVVAQHAEGFPNSAQVIYYVGFPGAVSAMIAVAIYFFNRVKRSRRWLVVFALASLVPLLPFLLGYTRGV